MAAWLCRSTVIAVALPPKQAIELFTPEGERKWSAGWDPVYPRPERTAGPGAVFITGHDGHTTTWTCRQRLQASRARSARTQLCETNGDGRARGGRRRRNSCSGDIRPHEPLGRRRRAAGRFRSRLRRRHRRVGNRNRPGARLRRLSFRRIPNMLAPLHVRQRTDRQCHGLPAVPRRRMHERTSPAGRPLSLAL